MLLEVENLETTFTTDHGTYPVINDVDLHLHESEALGIVGESGCGKSVTALSIMQLIMACLSFERLVNSSVPNVRPALLFRFSMTPTKSSSGLGALSLAD